MTNQPIAIQFLDMDRFRMELDAEHFIALQTGLKHIAPSMITEADRRLLKAFSDFNDGLRAEIQAAAKHFPHN